MKMAHSKGFIFKRLPSNQKYKKTSLVFRSSYYFIKENNKTGDVSIDPQPDNGGLKDVIIRLYQIWKKRTV